MRARIGRRDLEQTPTGLFDFEGLARCPVCEAPTVSRMARWKLYLGSTERCAECMSGWRFVWGRGLYTLPIFGVFALEVAIARALGIAIDPLFILAAVALPIVGVPIFLPLSARLGDRLTDRAVRRVERADDVEASERSETPEEGGERTV